MQSLKGVLSSALLLAVSLFAALVGGEIVLRLKNRAMNNYDIEMWRYAQELKVKSENPEIDFDHVKSKSALLQNVDIRINEWGLRGGPVPALPNDARRILFLGGSITLGWGVTEADTIAEQVQSKFAARGDNVQVLNGGVGNYNTQRYVSRYFDELAALQPTDIVVQYFLRDAEELPPGGGNVFLRNSQLAVTLWIAYHRLFDRSGEASLVDHYRAVYQPSAHGFVEMQKQLAKLAAYAKQNNVRLFLAMTPDVHNLTDYKFGFVHEIMRGVGTQLGFTYVDLLPALAGRSPEQLWAMPGDPHPNALGHHLMADTLFPALGAAGRTAQ